MAPIGASATLPEALLVHLRGVPLWVTGVDVNGGPPVFADERAAALAAVEAWVIRNGLTIAPAAPIEARYARAAAGQHIETGAACGAPLGSYAAGSRWGDALGYGGRVEVDVFCQADCIIQASISLGIDGAGGTEYYAAPFDPTQPFVDEVVARLPRLVDNGGHEQHGHGNNPVAVRGVPLPAGLDAQVEAAALPADVAPRATACVAATGQRQGSATLAADATGVVTRCEPGAAGGDAADACVCAAWQGQRLPAGPPRRRAVVAGPAVPAAATEPSRDVTDDGWWIVAEHALDGAGELMASSPTLAGWNVPDHRLVHGCIVAGGTVPTESRTRATVSFDAVGHARSVVLKSLSGSLTAAQQACVRDLFMATEVPCPDSATSSAAADLIVEPLKE